MLPKERGSRAPSHGSDTPCVCCRTTPSPATTWPSTGAIPWSSLRSRRRRLWKAGRLKTRAARRTRTSSCCCCCWQSGQTGPHDFDTSGWDLRGAQCRCILVDVCLANLWPAVPCMHVQSKDCRPCSSCACICLGASLALCLMGPAQSLQDLVDIPFRHIHVM